MTATTATTATSVAEDYLTIVEDLHRRLEVPRIRRIWLPEVRETPDKSGEFGAVILADGSVGLSYVLLSDTLPRLRDLLEPGAWVGAEPVALAEHFQRADPLQRVLGLAAANAMAQHAMVALEIPTDTATNSIASFQPTALDRVGMVGFFPPLVSKLRAMGIHLTVVELKPELLEQGDRFQVTLDPAALRGCDKILCTSTLLLNDSLDSILAHCADARQIAVLGPGAGFLPDPLFARGVTTVGGNQVVEADTFITRCEAGSKWGDATRKYCFFRDSYPGYKALVK